MEAQVHFVASNLKALYDAVDAVYKAHPHRCAHRLTRTQLVRFDAEEPDLWRKLAQGTRQLNYRRQIKGMGGAGEKVGWQWPLAEVKTMNTSRRSAADHCIDQHQPLIALPEGDERRIDCGRLHHSNARQLARSQRLRSEQPDSIVSSPRVANAEHKHLFREGVLVNEFSH